MKLTRMSRICLALLLFVCGAVSADQSDPALIQLYKDLSNAEDAATASQIEGNIWKIWLSAPNAEATELLKKTTDAMSQSDYREALILATQLTEDYPDYAEAWNKRATIYYLIGNYDQSVNDIYETLKREPKHFGAISGLGLIFQRQGKLEPALSAFEQVLSISPQSMHARRNAELIREQLGSEI